MTHSTINCPCCKVGLGQDQFARGEPTPITDDAGVVTDIRRVIYIYCDRCGGFELLFSVCEAKVIAIIPADQPADDNRILSKLPRRSTAPRGTAKSKVVYAPAEVFA